MKPSARGQSGVNPSQSVYLAKDPLPTYGTDVVPSWEISSVSKNNHLLEASAQFVIT